MTDASPLERYLVPMRRWWPVLAVSVVLGLLVAWVTLPPQPSDAGTGEMVDPSAAYRATQVLLGSGSGSAANFELVTLLAEQGELTNRIVERMDGRVTADDVEAMEITPNPNTNTLSVTTVQPTPELAAELTRAYSQELNGFLLERDRAALDQSIERVEEQLARLDVVIDEFEQEIVALPETSVDRQLLEADLALLVEEYAALQSELRGFSDQRVAAVTPFETLQDPSPVSTDLAEAGSLSAIVRDPIVWFPLAALLAGVLGVAAVLIIDVLDTRVRTRHDVEEYFGLPVVAELPRRTAKDRNERPLPVRSEPEGVTAEAVRSLRLSVLVAPTWRLSGGTPTGSGAVGTAAAVSEHEPPRSLLVTSALTGDGKTTLVANLAASFADAGQRVLVVDCDFRRPAVASLLGVGAGRGLRDLVNPQARPLEELLVDTEVPGVQMVRSGRESGIAPAWFLSHSRTVVEQATGLADIVIFDAGPLMLTNEALSLIPSVETVVLVVRSGRVTRDQAREAVERLTRVSANIAGVVLLGSGGARRYGYYQPAEKRTDQPVPSGTSTPAVFTKDHAAER